MEKQYIKIDEYGHKFYFKDKEMTKLHREDGPAVEYANGDKLWYINDECHREDGPAIEYTNGDKEWYVNGELLSKSQFNARNNPVELTLEDIAAKFNIDVSKLKIVK